MDAEEIKFSRLLLLTVKTEMKPDFAAGEMGPVEAERLQITRRKLLRDYQDYVRREGARQREAWGIPALLRVGYRGGR